MAGGGIGLQVLNPQILGYFIDTAVVGGPQQMLDEASSRLDPLTEQLIERAVDRRLENRTGIHWAQDRGTGGSDFDSGAGAGGGVWRSQKPCWATPPPGSRLF